MTLTRKRPLKGMVGRPGKVRVTVDFTVAEFEALERLVGRAGAKGKGDLIRYTTKLFTAILSKRDDLQVKHDGLKDDEVYLGLVARKQAAKIDEPEW